ncbi:MAG TPA: MFS transporter [Rhodopila sp.]
MSYNASIPLSKPLTAADEEATYAKVTWRLMPFLFVCYVVAYLDRVNVGFAKLQMLTDLKFSETAYGLGAGIFFIGYFLFEVPSNVLMYRVGARAWIARIMITWGIISGMMMFVSSPTHFYILRFLLGVAEAGFFPGIILYLTYWYPSHRRGKMVALFMTANPVSGVIGGPLSGWILNSFAGLYGWAGWQWLFLIEALPSIVMGIAVFFYLDDGIRKANWVSEGPKQILEKNIESEAGQKEDHSVFGVFRSGKVWLISLIHFCLVMGVYGIGFWLPSIIRATGVKDAFDVGLLTMIPYGAAIVAMILVSRSADKHRERRWHLAVAAVIGGIGLIFSAIYSDHTMLAMAGLTVATAGIISSLPVFWSLPTAFLGGTAAAAGIALINSVGNLAGFVSPYLIGWIKDVTQSTNIGVYMLAGALFAGAVLVLTVPARLVNK